MRANGKDLAELFGYSPDDGSIEAQSARREKICIFTGSQCTKTNHDRSIIYGVCSVTEGSKPNPSRDVVICPKRLYGNDFQIIRNIAIKTWGADYEFIAGGNLQELKQKKELTNNRLTAIAFGQNSGKEISISVGAQMSMDWVVQTYCDEVPEEFIGIEVQSIDITGNYREAHSHYMENDGKVQNHLLSPPRSQHGLNWANVHKRLIPQLIRKGNIYKDCKRCRGFFFIIPEVVYERFQDVLGTLEEMEGISPRGITIVTVSLSCNAKEGTSREIKTEQKGTYTIDSIKEAFSSMKGSGAHEVLNETLLTIL